MKIFKILIIIFLCFVIHFCSNKNEISSLEYEIYSYIIDSLYVRNGAPFVLIGDSTKATIYTDRKVLYEALDLDYITKDLPIKEQKILLNNYVAVNRKRYDINEKNINVKIDVFVSPMRRFFQILREKHEHYNIKSTRKSGVFFFSRVGFNSNKTYAILFYDYNCGGLCGWPAYCYLKKSKSGWQILDDYHLGTY